jgi:hypothetical protein
LTLENILSEEEVLKKAYELPAVKRHLEGKVVEKTIFIHGKILSSVAK